MASAAMVVYCFDTLQSHFDGGVEPTPRFDVQQEYPLFVTWEIEEQGGTHLRGCIGTLAPTRLRNLRDFTFKSALRDRRFDPIGPQELHRLHCSVSLLVDFQDAGSFDDWEIGTHGIIIDFSDARGSEYSATYLPQVAREQGWTHVETVTSLMRKAGYRRSVSQDMLKTVKVTRYRSSIHKLTYQQYLSLKQEILDSA
ncbi:uncharacterized protein IUM83_12716 [Phytophthora cinnamomi]|uniref:uncharacterized protein n=1 Tax=Phytophthora cinnamomi TaxID=4785 RepID=UPI00355A1582|nr:hypothetical protein IUM83_12716 [Phytophthora cinnamomi]